MLEAMLVSHVCRPFRGWRTVFTARWDSSCELSDRCNAALEFGVGCCTHASAANATGATSLTASLRWRPTGVMGVNTAASGVSAPSKP